MEQRVDDGLSPYVTYSRSAWAALREDVPMTLSPEEVTRLHSMHDRLDMKEVEDIYLPLSRLLSLYVAATQRLHRAQQRFLGGEDAKVPYVIGVAGSVAVGKSTTARVLEALLARWPNVPKVDLVTTDGFLLPNAVLEREGLMEKKGFPESYDLPGLLLFLSDVKAGRRPVRSTTAGGSPFDPDGVVFRPVSPRLTTARLILNGCFDAVVIDPPRAGALAQADALAASRVPVVAWVSCDPVTFARDARVMLEGGYALDRIEVIDQFRWSPHVELTAAFTQ